MLVLVTERLWGSFASGDEGIDDRELMSRLIIVNQIYFPLPLYCPPKFINSFFKLSADTIAKHVAYMSLSANVIPPSWKSTMVMS